MTRKMELCSSLGRVFKAKEASVTLTLNIVSRLKTWGAWRKKGRVWPGYDHVGTCRPG